MPMYDFENKETKERFTRVMSYSSKIKYLEENPHIVSIFTSAPGVSVNTRSNKKKPDDGFRDVLKEVQKAHPINKINTF